MSKIAQMATLMALSIDALWKDAVKDVKTEQAINAKVAGFAETVHTRGKRLAALQIKFADEVGAGRIAQGIPFEEYHKQITGEKPNNHALSLASAYRNYVVTGQITEQDFDDNTADALQAAATVSTLSKNEPKSKSMQEASAILKRRPKDGTKQLKDMKASMQGKVKDEETGKVVKLTTAETVTLTIRAAFSAGLGAAVFEEIARRILSAGDLSDKDSHDLYVATLRLGDLWAKSGVSEDQQNQWADEHAKNNTPKPAIRVVKELQNA